MDIDKNLLGNRIKSIRLSLGDNMREFGERIGNKLRKTSNLSDELDPSDSIVSRWEKGVSMPSPDRLKAIADLSNISVDELLYGTPEQYFFKLIASIVTKKYDSGISPAEAMKIKKELEEQGLVDVYSHTPESIHSLYYDYFEKVFKKDNIYNKLSEAAGYGSKEVHSKINNVTFDTKNLSVIYEFSTGEKISHNFKIVENTSILTNNQYNLEKVTITGAPLSIVKKLQDTYFDTDYGYKDNSKQVTIDYFRIRYFFDVKELLKTYLNDHNNIISFEDKEGVTQTVEVTKPITFILQETLPDKRVGYGDHITIE